MDSNALPNILTIGPPESPILTLYNQPQNGNGDQILSISGVFGGSVVVDTLPIDEINAVVRYGGPLDVGMGVWEVYLGPNDEVYLDPDGESVYAQLLANVPDGSRDTSVDLAALPYATPITWICDGRLIAAFYLKRVKRVGKHTYTLTAMSGIGLLDRIKHVGGIYSGETFATIAADIIGDAFPYTVAPALASQKIYGWLPYDTARANLHQLLFAMGASAVTDAEGTIQLLFVTAGSPAALPASRVSVGGSVDLEEDVSEVDVTEYQYMQTGGQNLTLFDNTSPASQTVSQLVVFEKPIQVSTLHTTGTLVIDDSGAACGVNWARVTGIGTLVGTTYLESPRVVAAYNPSQDVYANVKTVDGMTLVNPRCSRNTAERVLDYYMSARKIHTSLTVVGGDDQPALRSGTVLNLPDPFSDPVTAFLETMTMRASTNLLALSDLVANYAPKYFGNGGSGHVFLTHEATWTSPITGTITVYLVGGGPGGPCGQPGASADGAFYTRDYGGNGLWTEHLIYADGGAGGDSGLSVGHGGNVYIVDIPVTVGQVFDIVYGVGGAGAPAGSPGVGADGTATTITDRASGTVYSSDYGSIRPDGVLNPTGDILLGAPGARGIAGGRGASASYEPPAITVNGVSYTAGARGTETHTASFRQLTPSNYQIDMISSPGFGGGPAYGANGSPGTSNGSVQIDAPGGIFNGCTLYASSGGRGADAVAPPPATGYGQGGTSGNGGGGGGAFGTPAESVESNELNLGFYLLNAAGAGGNGSDGGKGGPGCIDITWGA